MRLPARREWAYVGFGAAVAVWAVLLRLRSSSTLWLDEAQSVGIARLPLGDLLDALRADGAPPLYYLALHGWIAIFGESDAALRSLSVVFGLATLPLLGLVAWRLTGSRSVAWTAVVVGATNPWMIRYSGETRMYSLVALLVVLGVLALDRVVRRGRKRDVVALSAVTGALLLTHYWALFLLAAVGLGLLWSAYVRPPRRTAVRRGLLGLAGGGVLFAPWVPSLLFQVQHTGAPWAEQPSLGRLAALPLAWSGGDLPGGRWLLLLLLPLLLLGALAHRSDGMPGLTFGRSVGAWLAGAVLGTLLLALVVTRLTSSGMEIRYTAVVVPLVLLLVARGVWSLPRRWALGATAGLAVLGVIASTNAGALRRTSVDRVADALNDYAMPGDVLLVCPDQLAPSLSRRLRPEVLAGLSATTVPAGTRLDPIDWVDYEARIEASSPGRIADAASTRAGTGAVWTYTSGNYLTHESVCGDLGGALASSGRQARAVVTPDPKAFETGLLERWEPRTPWDAAADRFGRLGAARPTQR